MLFVVAASKFEEDSKVVAASAAATEARAPCDACCSGGRASTHERKRNIGRLTSRAIANAIRLRLLRALVRDVGRHGEVCVDGVEVSMETNANEKKQVVGRIS
jgi:hypothetical protein